jgi:hypothetical protein
MERFGRHFAIARGFLLVADKLTYVKVKCHLFSIAWYFSSKKFNFWLAIIRSQVHKDRAFQASSPKTFKAGPFGIGLFFAALKRRRSHP